VKVSFHIPQNKFLQPVFKSEVKQDSIKCNADKTTAMPPWSSGACRFNDKAEKIGAYGLQKEIGLKGIDHRHQCTTFRCLKVYQKF